VHIHFKLATFIYGLISYSNTISGNPILSTILDFAKLFVVVVVVVSFVAETHGHIIQIRSEQLGYKV